ncbi:MAG: L-histidine N(alpha)-methyltransferase [Ekhidna sp.]|uniref:L-histidine N(alpha)-methyltransferase n=1 Tax=Ekhidna sp. TaxID=2608089 RepID=UPI0032EBC3F9
MTKESTTLTPFAEDVMEGLQAEKKHLPSKYFYDVRGDELFQQIMQLDEYYLTRKELEIFETHKAAILEAIDEGEPFRIIELGAGDGSKTKVLLKHFLDAGADFAYTPVDISGNVLEILEGNLKAEMPNLRIESYEGDYFDALAEISESPEKDIVFFLGSTVGNFGQGEAEGFLSKLQEFLKPGDLLFMGVDLKKDPSIILNAYNDSQGVTKEFNLNLLDRINQELGADFDRDQFIHYPYYNPHTGECRSYLISQTEQTVTIDGDEIEFRSWEAIFMEISKKYDQKQLKSLADASGFTSLKTFLDSDKWFADVLWEK